MTVAWYVFACRSHSRFYLTVRSHNSRVNVSCHIEMSRNNRRDHSLQWVRVFISKFRVNAPSTRSARVLKLTHAALQNEWASQRFCRYSCRSCGFITIHQRDRRLGICKDWQACSLSHLTRRPMTVFNRRPKSYIMDLTRQVESLQRHFSKRLFTGT